MIQEKERLQLENLLALIYDLQQETWPYQNLTKKEALDKIIILAQILGVNIDPNDPEFLPLMTTKIIEISSQTEAPEAPSLPPNLDELVEIYEKEEAKKAIELQKKLTSQENYKRYQKFNNEFKKIILKTDPEIPQKLAEKMAQNVTDKVIFSLPPVAQADFFTEEIKNQVLQEAEKIVNAEFEKIKQETVLQEAEKIVNAEFEKIKQETVQNKSQNIITEAQRIAATPEIIRPFQELTKTIDKSYLEAALPQNILEQLTKSPEGIAYLPLYTVLYPKATAAFIEKGIYTLPAKMLKLAAEGATPEWQAMINQGVFYEDFQASINHLKKIGLSEKHPLLLKLSDKADRFKEQQKIEYKDKKGNVFYKDTRAASILKHYYHFNKATGQQKIYDNDLKANLPRLSPTADWSMGGYSNLVKRVLGRFHFFSNNYQKFSKFVTKGQYTSLFAPIKQFISKKFVQPTIKWLAKTAAGKAIKAGAKKVAVWAATRLGVEIGATIAGTAAGGVPGIVIAIASIAFEALKFVGGKIVNFIKQVINDPEKALMAIGVGAILLVFTSMPIALIGIVPIVFGGLGLASFALAPVTLGAAGAGIGGFFAVLAASPIIFPVALFFIIVLSVLALLTLFILLIVSGAFILPHSVTEVAMTTVSPYESPYFELKKTANPTKIDNSELINGKTIQYQVTIKAKENYKLTIKSISENISLNKEGIKPTLSTHSFAEDLKDKREVGPGETWEANYSIEIDNNFKDTAIINTVNVVLTNETGTFPGTTSAVVIIGEPPMQCPSGWPAYGRITQGPDGAKSHKKDNSEAIDIASIPMGRNGTPVYATHNGKASTGFNSVGGYYVQIKGNCNGIDFWTYYGHLLYEGRLPNGEGDVIKGDLIGLMDNTGTGSRGTHVHYGFYPKSSNDPIKMEPPYIPQALPYRSCNSFSECGSIITNP